MGSFYHAQSATTRDEEAPDLEDERSFRPGGYGGGPAHTFHTDWELLWRRDSAAATPRNHPI